MNDIYQKYFMKEGRFLAALIDPDKKNKTELKQMAKRIKQSLVDFILVGSSLNSFDYTESIALLKEESEKDVVLFPGSSMQLSDKADALLNLSLLSGRNPELLIGEHVKSALLMKRLGIEIIPTAYMLIDGGVTTSVQYISGTQSIPREKHDIALSTALAGQYLGFRTVYLEAGSGAKFSVPDSMISLLSKELDIPIICGGGIKDLASVNEKWDAGANIVVVGTAFEENLSFFDKK